MTDLMNSSLQETEEPEEEHKVEELFLLHLRYKAALLEKLGHHEPIMLADPHTSWIVYAGWVDVFAVPLKDGKADGARRHLFRVPAGQALFGMRIDLATSQVGLLAVSSNNASLLKVAAKQLQKLGHDEEFGEHVASLIDQWVKNLSHTLTTILPPKECIPLDASKVLLNESDTASAKRGVLWIKHEQGKSYFMGNMNLPALNGTVRWPLSSHTWLQAAEPSQLDVIKTTTFIRYAPNGFGLEPFHDLMLRQLALWIDQNKIEDRIQLQNKIESNQEIVEDAFTGLAVRLTAPNMGLPNKTGIDNPLWAACHIIGDQLGIEIQEPPLQRQGEHYDPLSEIARASRFQMRRVALKGKWWRQDNGPLLAYMADENVQNMQPVALMPRVNKGYELHNPQSVQPQMVDENIALSLHPFAYMFYRPFPAKSLNLPDLIRFGLQNTGYDLRNMLLYGLGVSLIGLLIPIATGLIVDTIIPNGAAGQLLSIGLLLVFAAVAATLLRITQNIAMLRLQGKMGTAIQAAMLDRLLSLPTSFFRNFTAGDLGSRVMGISAIERTISGTVMQALLSGLFSVTSFLLLYYYDSRLAVVATFLGAAAVGITVFAGRVQIRYQRTVTEIQGRLSGIVLQTITGITKIRAAGVEGYGFASWAKDFGLYKQIDIEAREAANNLLVFNSAFPLITSMTIFGMVAFSTQITLSTGEFLAFNVAFIQFLTALLSLSQAYVGVLNVVPTYERAQPILEILPEVDEMKADPGELTGAIEVSHVSFRYQEDSPLILKDVSLTVHPGEFIALVGSSGSGKSTLFRLLLGFEAPQSGAVYYNGHDLLGLDIREVRRQIGVVLQDGKVMSGDIFTNIIGSSLLTIDDAWGAARMAGLEEDIKGMPMGMHTVVSSGGNTLSGGQRQRLLIARALVHKPRVLFFDEATSALDNNVQAVVSESLDNLKATRIVIAHRLSTIINADRIYVLQNGRIVQQGTYNTLIQQKGPFAELAKRQMA